MSAAPDRGAGHCPTCGGRVPSAAESGAAESGAAESGATAPWRIVTLMADTSWGQSFLGRSPEGPAAVVIRIARARLATEDAALAQVGQQRTLGATPIHPAMAALRDVGLLADGRLFVVRDYVEGQPLDAFIRRYGLAPAARTGLLSRVREALEVAHGCGVVHGHLVPANVLVSLRERRATPVLTDVGLHVTERDRTRLPADDLVDLAALGADPRSES
jgi:serine/threonine protein kinase